MNGAVKFAIGALATAGLALLAHGPLAAGQGFSTYLRHEAETVVEGVPDVTVAMVSKPALERVVILSGPQPEAERDRLLTEVKAIDGMKDARWERSEVAVLATASVAAPEAEPGNVADCQAEIDGLIAGETIRFETARAVVGSESDPLLSAIAEVLRRCPDAAIQVEGHTDERGDAAANQSLSEARANAVVAILVAKGVPPRHLTARGFGETRPRDTGLSDEAQAQNRRIEFALTDSDALPKRLAAVLSSAAPGSQ